MASPFETGRNQSSIGQTINETAANVAEKAKETASTVGQRADDAVGAMGAGIRNLGGTVRDKAPHDGMIGAASSGVASALENSGRFIEKEKLSGMAHDVTNLLKQNPLLTLCIGLGAGFLLAQLVQSSRR